MKKFMSKRYMDMTIGETMKFTLIMTAVLSAVTYGMMYIVFKIDDIVSACGEFKDMISDRIARYKAKRISEEDEGLY